MIHAACLLNIDTEKKRNPVQMVDTNLAFLPPQSEMQAVESGVETYHASLLHFFFYFFMAAYVCLGKG